VDLKGVNGRILLNDELAGWGKETVCCGLISGIILVTDLGGLRAVMKYGLYLQECEE